MIRVEGVPMQRNCTLLCYDTGGECFEKPTQLITYAGFVRRATTALFLVSVPDLENPREGMHRLLNTYVVGMHELGARTQDQHLVVVYTKADEMAAHLANPWNGIHTYLAEGTADGMEHTDKYIGVLPYAIWVLLPMLSAPESVDILSRILEDEIRGPRHGGQ